MKNTSPRFRLTIAGTNARVTKNALRKFVATIRSNSATLVSKNGAIANAPALLISTSTAPNRSVTAAVIAATDASSLTSHAKISTAAAPPPARFAHARATVFSFFSFRATSASCTPRTSWAKTRAMASPIPCDAPVMSTTGFFMVRRASRQGRGGRKAKGRRPHPPPAEVRSLSAQRSAPG